MLILPSKKIWNLVKHFSKQKCIYSDLCTFVLNISSLGINLWQSQFIFLVTGKIKAQDNMLMDRTFQQVNSQTESEWERFIKYINIFAQCAAVALLLLGCTYYVFRSGVVVNLVATHGHLTYFRLFITLKTFLCAQLLLTKNFSVSP